MSSFLSKELLVLDENISSDAFPSHISHFAAATPASYPDKGRPDHRGPNG